MYVNDPEPSSLRPASVLRLNVLGNGVSDKCEYLHTYLICLVYMQGRPIITCLPTNWLAASALRCAHEEYFNSFVLGSGECDILFLFLSIYMIMDLRTNGQWHGIECSSWYNKWNWPSCIASSSLSVRHCETVSWVRLQTTSSVSPLFFTAPHLFPTVVISLLTLPEVTKSQPF